MAFSGIWAANRENYAASSIQWKLNQKDLHRPYWFYGTKSAVEINPVDVKTISAKI